MSPHDDRPRRITTELISFHYAEICKIARDVLRGEGDKFCIEAKDLAHEAILKIMRLDRIEFKNKSHFLATVTQSVKHVLVDHARRNRAIKRQSSDFYQAYVELELSHDQISPRALSLESAMENLDRIDPEKSALLSRRYVAGATVQEIAGEMGVSESTVKRKWREARTALLAEMSHSAP